MENESWLFFEGLIILFLELLRGAKADTEYIVMTMCVAATRDFFDISSKNIFLNVNETLYVIVISFQPFVIDKKLDYLQAGSQMMGFSLPPFLANIFICLHTNMLAEQILCSY